MIETVVKQLAFDNPKQLAEIVTNLYAQANAPYVNVEGISVCQLVKREAGESTSYSLRFK